MDYFDEKQQKMAIFGHFWPNLINFVYLKAHTYCVDGHLNIEYNSILGTFIVNSGQFQGAVFKSGVKTAIFIVIL